MAPPPAAGLPLTERLLTLAKTLQCMSLAVTLFISCSFSVYVANLAVGWFVGHLTLILCTLRYSLSWVRFNYYSFAARSSYRLAFVAAAATYGIVVYKTFKAQAKAGRTPKGVAGAIALLTDENVQYLRMLNSLGPYIFL